MKIVMVVFGLGALAVSLIYVKTLVQEQPQQQTPTHVAETVRPEVLDPVDKTEPAILPPAPPPPIAPPQQESISVTEPEVAADVSVKKSNTIDRIKTKISRSVNDAIQTAQTRLGDSQVLLIQCDKRIKELTPAIATAQRALDRVIPATNRARDRLDDAEFQFQHPSKSTRVGDSYLKERRERARKNYDDAFSIQTEKQNALNALLSESNDLAKKRPILEADIRTKTNRFESLKLKAAELQ